MELYFLRHGIAENATMGMSDEERALTGEGRTQLGMVAKAMQRLGVRPTTIFTSPLTRTWETAEIVAPLVGGTLQLAPELAPGCGFDDLQRLLRGVSGSKALLVGHAPDMGALAATLIGAGGNAIKLKKAGLVCVEYNGRPLPGIATLRFLLTPQMLEWIGVSQ